MLKTLMISIGIITLILFLLPSANAQYNSIEWSAYLTDKNVKMSDSEIVEHLIVNKEGTVDYIYITGQTKSTRAQNLFCGDSLGNGDCFLAKYTTAGKLKWIRYFGGSGTAADSFTHEKYDWAYCLASDKTPNGKVRIYVGGTVLRSNAAISCSQAGCTDPVYQSLPHDGWEGFIAKYDGNGTLLRWTYLGGGEAGKTDTDEVLGIAVHDHKVYAAGYTQSPQRSLLQQSKIQSSYDTTYNGGGDGFIAVFDTCLSKLQFFSYFNTVRNPADSINEPYDADRVHDIKVGIDGAVYMTGTSKSTAGISLNTGTFNHGLTDAFVSKWIIDTSGNLIPKWCRYIGGVQSERGRQIALDDEGNIFVDGTTRSNDSSFTAVGNVIQKNSGGDTDGFAAKLDSNGNLKWLTYLGGKYQDVVNGIQYVKTPNDTGSYIAIVGLTLNCSLFSSKNYSPSILNVFNGNSTLACPPAPTDTLKRDAFVIFLTDPDHDASDSMHITFGSFLGGSKNETFGPNETFTGYGPSVDFSSTGTMYVALSSVSKDVGDINHGHAMSIKGKYHGATDAIIMKFPKTVSSGKMNEPEIFNNHQTQLAEAYPQPFQHMLTLEFTEAIPQSFLIRILSEQGSCMKTISMNPVNAFEKYAADLSDLDDGIYFLQIVSAQKNEVIKIIRQ